MDVFKFIFKFLLGFRGKKQVETEDGGDVTSYTDVHQMATPQFPLRLYTSTYVAGKEGTNHYIIDCGHGRLTAGKRSPVLEDGRQLLEYKFNYAVGLIVSEMLTELNIDHTLIPPNPEIMGNDLSFRYNFANNLRVKRPKIFISIHGNAGPVKNPEKDWSTRFRGVETWHYHGSPHGRTLAQIFQHYIVRETGLHDRGTMSKPTKQFSVLANTNMPAVLTENGFYNNPDECKLMLTPCYQRKVATAHVNAIVHVEENGINL